MASRDGVEESGGEAHRAAAASRSSSTGAMTQVAAVKGEGNAPGRKVNWTTEEDNELRRLIGIHGKNKWSDIAKGLVGKQPKQCRRRWQHCLSVTLKTGEWTLEVRPPRADPPHASRGPRAPTHAGAGACSGPAGPARASSPD